MLKITQRDDPERRIGGEAFPDARPAPRMDRFLRLKVGAMNCSSCARTIEKALLRTVGVSSALIDFGMRRAEVVYDASSTSPERIVGLIEELGYSAAKIEGRQGREKEPAAHNKEKGVLAFAMGAVILAHAVLGARSLGWVETATANLLLFLVATPLQFGVGLRYYKGAYQAFRLARSATLDTLVAISTSAAYGYSLYLLIARPGAVSYFDSSAVIVSFIYLGNYLKGSATRKAYSALEKISARKVRRARLRTGNTVRQVPLESIRVGDILSVKPGEKIPADAVVVEGGSHVLESMVTGEPLPVRKGPGESVIGGTINQSGHLLLRATRVGRDTLLARIGELVEKARHSRTRIQDLGDRLTRYFVPGVLVLAAASFLGWAFSGNQDFDRAVLAAVAVLIVACPCALTLAPGAAFAVSLGRASENGVLVKDVKAFEKASSIEIVAFDKTGTLTTGVFHLSEVVPLGDFSRDALLSHAASVEQHSEHPLAGAVEKEARESGLAIESCRGFEAVSGYGVKGVVKGKTVLVGNLEFLDREGAAIAGGRAACAELGQPGLSLSAVAIDGGLAGILAFTDEIKPKSREIVQALQDQGIEVVLLTGDHFAVAQRAAKQLNIKTAHGDMTPEGKLALLEQWNREGRKVMMVGDGINDAPALANAYLGAAMGSGTDLAMGTADVVLLGSGLRALVYFLTLSGGTLRVLRQNFGWAFIFNLVALPYAATGLLHPILGALGMVASSLLVVGNSLRLKRI